jgi:hypothetical protein
MLDTTTDHIVRQLDELEQKVDQLIASLAELQLVNRALERRNHALEEELRLAYGAVNGEKG